MSGLVERAMERLESGEQPPRVTREPSTPAPRWRILRDASPVPLDLALGRPVVLDLAGLEAAGLLTTLARRTPLAEEFASIRRDLLAKADATDRGNMIMVTSPRASPGKTRAAINLAMSTASAPGRRVLLIDADAQSPSLLTTLGVKAPKGFFDALDQPGVPLADTILRTNIARLSLLGAGLPLDRAAHLLAGEKAEELMSELASRYTDRVVIFDAPPLSAGETAALGRYVGQIVVAGATEAAAALVEETRRLAGSRRNVTLLQEKAARRTATGLRALLRRPR
jgi:protein-tyrosine kinase